MAGGRAMSAPTNAELDDQTLFADEAQVLATLATMCPTEYGKQRQAIAQELGINVTFLDAEWKERRKATKRGASEQTSTAERR
jgi:hypothetical protein